MVEFWEIIISVLFFVISALAIAIQEIKKGRKRIEGALQGYRRSRR